jgi:hypothetical protein
MSVTLPPAIAAYFAATNAHDVPAMVAAFSEDAVVEDEKEQHGGLESIRAWMNDTIAKYDFHVEPTNVADEEGKTIVNGLVSGNFPGSPVSLRYSFTFADEKIARLRIG